MGLLAYIFVIQARREAKTEARLRTIREMNHHIRNALQVISYWVTGEEDQQEVRMLRDSVERIEWALRDVLPQTVDPPLSQVGPLASMPVPTAGAQSSSKKLSST